MRIVVKLLMGAFIGGVLGSFFSGGDWIYTIVWAVAIPAVLLGSMLVGTRNTRGIGFGIARIETIQRAALEADGRQQCEARVVVQPANGTPYSTTATLMLSTDELRQYVAGTIVLVALNGMKPDVAVVSTAPPAVLEAAAKARLDPSLIPTATDVPAWETATTTTPGTKKPGSATRPWEGAVSALIIALGAVITLVPVWPSIAHTIENIAVGDPNGSNLVLGRYQQEAVDQVAAVAGSYDFTRVGFYSDYLLVTGLTAPGATTTDDYQWRYGRAYRDGPALIQSNDLQHELFDASKLDFSMIPTLVRDAIKRADLDNAELPYVSVYRGPGGDEPYGEPEIGISLRNDYYDAYFTYSFEGELLTSSGSAFTR